MAGSRETAGAGASGGRTRPAARREPDTWFPERHPPRSAAAREDAPAPGSRVVPPSPASEPRHRAPHPSGSAHRRLRGGAARAPLWFPRSRRAPVPAPPERPSAPLLGGSPPPSSPRLQDGVLDDLSPGGVSMGAFLHLLSPGATALLIWNTGTSDGKGASCGAPSTLTGRVNGPAGLHVPWGTLACPPALKPPWFVATPPAVTHTAGRQVCGAEDFRPTCSPLANTRCCGTSWADVPGACFPSEQSPDSPSWPQPPTLASSHLLVLHVAPVFLSATWQCQVWWPWT